MTTATVRELARHASEAGAHKDVQLVRNEHRHMHEICAFFTGEPTHVTANYFPRTRSKAKLPLLKSRFLYRSYFARRF